MGEKKLDQYLTFNDLAERYGWSKWMLYRRSKDLEPALLKINGKPVKPYKYNADKLEEIINTGAPAKKDERKPSRALNKRKTKKLRDAPGTDEIDDLFD